MTINCPSLNSGFCFQILSNAESNSGILFGSLNSKNFYLYIVAPFIMWDIILYEKHILVNVIIINYSVLGAIIYKKWGILYINLINQAINL